MAVLLSFGLGGAFFEEDELVLFHFWLGYFFVVGFVWGDLSPVGLVAFVAQKPSLGWLMFVWGYFCWFFLLGWSLESFFLGRPRTFCVVSGSAKEEIARLAQIPVSSWSLKAAGCFRCGKRGLLGWSLG